MFENVNPKEQSTETSRENVELSEKMMKEHLRLRMMILSSSRK